MYKLSTLALVAGLGLLPATQAAAYTVKIYDAAPMTTLAQADAAIAGTATATVFASVIEYDDLEDTTRGLFSVNNAWPIAGSPDNTFAAHVTGTFYIADAGTWTFGINHDDGARLTIDGSLVASFGGVTDNINTLITASFAAGYHTVDIVYFENDGGASLEFFGKRGTTASTAPYALIQSVPEPASLALVGLALLGAGAAGKRRRA